MTSKVWEVMNDLEMTTSKACSAREIVDSVLDALSRNDYQKAESLASAAYEFLGYYLDEFDEKFKLAWKETVTKMKPEPEIETSSQNVDWNSYWNNTDQEVQSWHIPVQIDEVNGDYFLTLPDDLIEKVGWIENDILEWTENQDGSWTLTKLS